MAGEVLARERLKQILGGSPSPQVPRFMLRRDAELVLGGQGGYRVSKYGAEGIAYGLNMLAESWKGTPQGDWLKANEAYVARILTGGSSLAAILMLKGKWSRIFAFGACFENLTYLIDILDSYVRTAVKPAT